MSKIHFEISIHQKSDSLMETGLNCWYMLTQTVKKSACHAGEPGLIPGLGRSLGEGNGSPLECSCLENSMDRGAWQAIVHRSQRVRHNWATFTQTLTSSMWWLYICSLKLSLFYNFWLFSQFKWKDELSIKEINEVTTKFSPQRVGFHHVLLCTQITMGFLLHPAPRSTFPLCSSLPCFLLSGAGLTALLGLLCPWLLWVQLMRDIGRRSGESRGETLVYLCRDSTLLWRRCIAGSSHVFLKLHLRAAHGFWLWLAPGTVFSSLCTFCTGILAASHWCWPLGASTPLVVSQSCSHIC